MAEGENNEIVLEETISFNENFDSFDKFERWSYKDIVEFYDRVRMALSAVSSQTLPDSYMDLPEKAPFAERYIKSRVPQWKDLDEEKFAIFESIIVYQTATMFQSLVSNKHIRKKSIPTISLQYSDNIDNLISGMSLKDMIEWLLSEINGIETGSGYIGFKVTTGTQNKKNICGCFNESRNIH